MKSKSDSREIVAPGWRFIANENDTAFVAVPEEDSLTGGSSILCPRGDRDRTLVVTAGSAGTAARRLASRVLRRYVTESAVFLVIATLCFWTVGSLLDPAAGVISVCVVAMVWLFAVRPDGIESLPGLASENVPADERLWDFTSDQRHRLLLAVDEPDEVRSILLQKIIERRRPAAEAEDLELARAQQRRQNAHAARADSLLASPRTATNASTNQDTEGG